MEGKRNRWKKERKKGHLVSVQSRHCVVSFAAATEDQHLGETRGLVVNNLTLVEHFHC